MNWIKVDPKDQATWPTRGKRVLLFQSNHPFARRSIGYSFQVGKLDKLDKEYWWRGDNENYLMDTMDITHWSELEQP